MKTITMLAVVLLLSMSSAQGAWRVSRTLYNLSPKVVVKATVKGTKATVKGVSKAATVSAKAVARHI